MFQLLRLLTSNDFGGETTSIRRTGLRRVSVGAVILATVGSFVAILFAIVDSPRAIKAILTISLPLGIAGLVAVAVGALQAITGRTWNDNPQWVRLLALVVMIPATIFVGAVSIAVIVKSF